MIYFVFLKMEMACPCQDRRNIRLSSLSSSVRSLEGNILGKWVGIRTFCPAGTRTHPLLHSCPPGVNIHLLWMTTTSKPGRSRELQIGNVETMVRVVFRIQW